MALLKTITLTNGLSAENAYCRIYSIMGNKSLMSIEVKSYVSQSAYTEDTPCLESNTYVFTTSVADGATNFIKQGYVYLKTLSEFSSATDV